MTPHVHSNRFLIHPTGALSTKAIKTMKTLAILFGLCGALAGSPIPDFPFIYVKGHASEEIPTSLVTIRFDLAKHSRTSAEGESALSDASKAAKQALRELGVKDKEIHATEILKRQEFGEFPQYSGKKESADTTALPPPDGPDESAASGKKEVYFTFRQEFVLKITDLKLYPALARHLMRSGDVSRYDVEFSATNRDEVVERLRKAAFADAKRAARNIAEASGETLGRIHSASEMPYSDLGQLVGESSGMELPAGASVSDEVYVVPPSVSESFSVNVLFRLKQGTTKQSE